MSNKGFNPLFVSALDILTGALSVFIVLNFLNTRLDGVPPVPVNPPGQEKKTEQGKAQASANPRPAEEPRAWWRKPQPAEPQRPQAPPPQAPIPQSPNPQQPNTQSPVNQSPNPQSPTPPSPPQDPVTVDLMKQTKGAVVILLQQADQSKQSVEFMLRQGSRTWKPSRVSKYQDNGFRYEKALNYFYQTDIEPGVYEVLVKVKKGQKSEGRKPFSMFGKIVPPGQKAQTYNFGHFALDGNTGDWVAAGTLRINTTGLQYQSRLPEAAAGAAEPAPVSQTAATKPTAKRSGKWQ